MKYIQLSFNISILVLGEMNRRCVITYISAIAYGVTSVLSIIVFVFSLSVPEGLKCGELHCFIVLAPFYLFTLVVLFYVAIWGLIIKSKTDRCCKFCNRIFWVSCFLLVSLLPIASYLFLILYTFIF